MIKYSDNYWMEKAISLAKEAEVQDEVPVGAVIVLENQIIGSGFNKPISTHNPAAHAEIIALQDAATKMQNYRLPNTTMYVTLEPCIMCVGAIIHARIKRVVFGAFDDKTGAIGSKLNLMEEYKWNHHFEYEGGILGKECGEILKNFFKNKR